jgi:hypothetical protein
MEKSKITFFVVKNFKIIILLFFTFAWTILSFELPIHEWLKISFRQVYVVLLKEKFHSNNFLFLPS